METNDGVGATLSEKTETPSTGVSSRPVSFCGFGKTAGPTGGLLVESADSTSSAAKAGIVIGDEILAVNGTRISEPPQAMALLQAAGVGATVTVTLVRQNAQLSIPMAVMAKSLAVDLDDLDEVVERKIAPAAS